MKRLNYINHLKINIKKYMVLKKNISAFIRFQTYRIKKFEKRGVDTLNGRDLAPEWNNLKKEQKTEFEKTGKIEIIEIQEEERRKKKEEEEKKNREEEGRKKNEEEEEKKSEEGRRKKNEEEEKKREKSAKYLY